MKKLALTGIFALISFNFSIALSDNTQIDIENETYKTFSVILGQKCDDTSFKWDAALTLFKTISNENPDDITYDASYSKINKICYSNQGVLGDMEVKPVVNSIKQLDKRTYQINVSILGKEDKTLLKCDFLGKIYDVNTNPYENHLSEAFYFPRFTKDLQICLRSYMGPPNLYKAFYETITIIDGTSLELY